MAATQHDRGDVAEEEAAATTRIMSRKEGEKIKVSFDDVGNLFCNFLLDTNVDTMTKMIIMMIMTGARLVADIHDRTQEGELKVPSHKTILNDFNSQSLQVTIQVTSSTTIILAKQKLVEKVEKSLSTLKEPFKVACVQTQLTQCFEEQAGDDT